MTRENAKNRIILMFNNPSWTPTQIKNCLDEIGKISPKENADFNKIILASSEACETPIATLRNKSNKRINVVARGLCYLELRKTGCTLEEIAHLFNKHHSSILHAIRAIRIDIEYDAFAKTSHKKFKGLLVEAD